MKLRNKKTGEIAYMSRLGVDGANGSEKEYYSLAELNEEWEDYEEPKKEFYLTAWGEVKEYSEEPFNLNHKLEIGNYFETKEEAEQAVEKLKAWKRLKDKGFKFTEWTYRYDQPRVKNHSYYNFIAICEDGEVYEDLDLLFGGEE